MKIKIYTIGLILLLLSVSACKADELESISANFGDKKQWIYVQLNIPEEGNKIDSYYYYGQISKALYKKIKSNDLASGFFHLSNIRYWDNDNKIAQLSRGKSFQGITFRIEDIRKLDHVVVPPQVGMTSDDLDKAELDSMLKTINKESKSIEVEISPKTGQK